MCMHACAHACWQATPLQLAAGVHRCRVGPSSHLCLHDCCNPIHAAGIRHRRHIHKRCRTYSGVPRTCVCTVDVIRFMRVFLHAGMCVRVRAHVHGRGHVCASRHVCVCTHAGVRPARARVYARQRAAVAIFSLHVQVQHIRLKMLRGHRSRHAERTRADSTTPSGKLSLELRMGWAASSWLAPLREIHDFFFRHHFFAELGRHLGWQGRPAGWRGQQACTHDRRAGCRGRQLGCRGRRVLADDF